MFQRKQNKPFKIDTLIAVGTRVNGSISFTGGLHLDGHVDGDVMGDAVAQLSVSEQGGIEGSVTVGDILLDGIVNGDIDATGRVELGANARVSGNVRYAVIETAVGAQIKGTLIHRGAAEDSAAREPLSGPRL